MFSRSLYLKASQCRQASPWLLCSLLAELVSCSCEWLLLWVLTLQTVTLEQTNVFYLYLSCTKKSQRVAGKHRHTHTHMYTTQRHSFNIHTYTPIYIDISHNLIYISYNIHINHTVLSYILYTQHTWHTIYTLTHIPHAEYTYSIYTRAHSCTTYYTC